ncbi:DUF4157 domain-containing protein [Streptomyces sp. NPDC002785]|uniref:eCIS core domain-containing protein n=1 Tax=Streptomyces sp. NPDC002785 TaxID=3154543 RepID=UPI0033176635
MHDWQKRGSERTDRGRTGSGPSAGRQAPSAGQELQRTVGNAAFARMVRRAHDASAPADAEELQRTVGNAAFARMVQRAHDASAPADAEEGVEAANRESVVAGAVHDVLRRPGRPLEDGVRTVMEDRLGADFGAVRVHDDAVADRSARGIGALAYTSGEHVVLGHGGRDPHTLAHELTHVIQQRSGPVAGSHEVQGLKVSDPSDRFERAAEANATWALADVQRAPSTTASHAGVSSGAGTAVQDGPAPVQRFVKVNITMYTDDPARTRGLPTGSADELVEKVAEAVRTSDDTTLSQEYEDNKDEVEKQARKWVADLQVGQPGPKSSAAFGRKAQNRSYLDHLDLARALVGWVLQKQGRREEKLYAQQLQGDPQFAADLDSVLRKVRGWIGRLGNEGATFADPNRGSIDMDRMMRELSTGRGTAMGGPENFGPYQRHFDKPYGQHPTEFGGAFLKVLDTPEDYGVRDKMIVLHDVYDYFKMRNVGRKDPETAGNGAFPDTPDGGPGSPYLQNTQELSPDGTRKTSSTDRGSKTTVRDEKAPSTKMARSNRIPVWAGASHTTARLLHLGRTAGATPEELNAVALGIFSFWRIDYDHTADLAAHTLHEVLDIASNFGVPYNANVSQAGSSRYPQVMRDRMGQANDKFEQQHTPLKNAVEQLEKDIDGRGTVKRLLNTPRKNDASRLLAQYNDALNTCKTLRNQADTASGEQLAALAENYAAALRSTLNLYDRICELVRSKRVSDTLTENDRDAVGARRLP